MHAVWVENLIFKDTIMIQNIGFLDFEKKKTLFFVFNIVLQFLSRYLKKKNLNDES